MFIVYDIVFFLFAVFYLPYLVVCGKWHSGFRMRFGKLGPSFTGKCGHKERVWIHAVSIGEVLAIVDLIRKVKEMFPRYEIICSTVTKTGHRIAEEKLGNDCTVIYAPLDFSWVVRKFISVIEPKIYISTETEIWPNLYTALHKKGIPIIQINGRISDKAFKGYKRIRFLTKRVLACVDILCMQSALDAERVQLLGVAPEKVRVVGNLKFDNVLKSIEARQEDLGFHEDDDLLIAGSTHPGEENILVDIYTRLTKEFCHLRLVIAPRHIERADAIMRLIEEKGYRPVRFSQIQNSGNNEKSIVVVDTIGHLRTLYGLAKIVFIGKTLTVGGGQNMIESVCLGKPTIVGPLTQNFRDVVDIFLKSKVLIQVEDPEGLWAEVRDLLAHPERAAEIEKTAKQTVEEYQGATLRTVEAIAERLD